MWPSLNVNIAMHPHRCCHESMKMWPYLHVDVAMPPCRCGHASTKIGIYFHANVGMLPNRCGHASMQISACLHTNLVMLLHMWECVHIILYRHFHASGHILTCPKADVAMPQKLILVCFLLGIVYNILQQLSFSVKTFQTIYNCN